MIIDHPLRPSTRTGPRGDERAAGVRPGRPEARERTRPRIHHERTRRVGGNPPKPAPHRDAIAAFQLHAALTRHFFFPEQHHDLAKVISTPGEKSSRTGPLSAVDRAPILHFDEFRPKLPAEKTPRRPCVPKTFGEISSISGFDRRHECGVYAARWSLVRARAIAQRHAERGHRATAIRTTWNATARAFVRNMRRGARSTSSTADSAVGWPPCSGQTRRDAASPSVFEHATLSACVRPAGREHVKPSAIAPEMSAD